MEFFAFFLSFFQVGRLTRDVPLGSGHLSSCVTSAYIFEARSMSICRILHNMHPFVGLIVILWLCRSKPRLCRTSVLRVWPTHARDLSFLGPRLRTTPYFPGRSLWCLVVSGGCLLQGVTGDGVCATRAVFGDSSSSWHRLYVWCFLFFFFFCSLVRKSIV